MQYAIFHYEIWHIAYGGLYQFRCADLASQRIEGESGGDQWVVFFDEVVRVTEAAVVSLWRKFDWQMRQDSGDRVRVVESQSRFPGPVTSFLESRDPIGPVMICEPFERFRDAWISVGNAGGAQGQNAVRCRGPVAREAAVPALTGLVNLRIDRGEVESSIGILRMFQKPESRSLK